MKLQILPRTCNLRYRVNYRQLTLLEQARRIADNSDTEARRQLYENRVFLYRYPHEKIVHIPEYIELLKNNSIARRLCDNNQMLLEQAYDLTLDKFFNMPSDKTCNYKSKSHGPNCCYYFKAFIDYVKERLKDNTGINAIELEIASAEMLQKFIERHFYLSCLEVKRRESKLVRRYKLQVNGCYLYLWMPVVIPGNRCRQWLIENIGKIDPNRPGEQDRVQSVINRLLARRRIYSLDQLHLTNHKLPAYNDTCRSMLEQEITVSGLADTVASEKAENFELQRPAIRALGPEKLKQLIHTVFDKLACGKYVERDIACSFGLSFSTLTRFAGSHWKQHCDDIISDYIPDLWRNTAQTLADHDDFAIAAKKAGVLKRVREILKNHDAREDSR